MKTLIVANWKCNPLTLADAQRLFDGVKGGIKKMRAKIRNAEIVICPPFIYLANHKSRTISYKIGAQDCFWEKKGAFTSAISPDMLKDLGCQYAIIGHSERRRYFNETDEQINGKIKAAIKANLTPILCIGESQNERREGRVQQVFNSQLKGALKGITGSKLKDSRLCIAYEPIWAIGSKNPCSNNEAMSMNLLIRKIIAQMYNRPLAEKLRVLYGGSVDSHNADGYIREAEMNGLLIGGASLKSLEFIKIVKAVSKE